jgi:hypothetical protein
MMMMMMKDSDIDSGDSKKGTKIMITVGIMKTTMRTAIVAEYRHN